MFGKAEGNPTQHGCAYGCCPPPSAGRSQRIWRYLAGRHSELEFPCCNSMTSASNRSSLDDSLNPRIRQSTEGSTAWRKTLTPLLGASGPECIRSNRRRTVRTRSPIRERGASYFFLSSLCMTVIRTINFTAGVHSQMFQSISSNMPVVQVHVRVPNDSHLHPSQA